MLRLAWRKQLFLAVPLVGCARRAVCSNVVGRGHLLGAVWGSVYGLEPFAVSDARTLSAMLWGCARTRAVTPLLVTVWNAELSANKARWQVAVDGSHFRVGEWDARIRRLTFSPRWLAMLGFRSQGFGDSLSAVSSWVHNEDKLPLRTLLEQL